MDARRIALLIGINLYPNLDPSLSLKGCVNDQQRLQRLLSERFGFDGRQIRLLLDEQATRDAILDALDRLAGMGRYEQRGSPLREGDVVFIGYSGHGSRLKEPDDQRDEADGYDSTLVPYDSDRPRGTGSGGPNRDITDDELRARFERISAHAGHLVLCFDCCHSGTIARDLEGEAVGRGIPAAETGYEDVPRVTAPPEAARGMASRGATGWSPLARERYLLIAGCADDEKARELTTTDKLPHGALTHYLIEALEQVSGPATYLDVFERARALVTARFPTQHPQIEGSSEQHLFGLSAEALTPAARVEARLDERRVRLTAGRMQGLRPGWRFRIEPPALAATERLAEVTVTSVTEASSEATSDEPLPPTVVAGCRALPTARPMGDEALPVAIRADDEALARQLAQLVEEEPRCRLVPLAEAALAAVLLPPRATVGAEDLAPELGPLAAPTWVLLWADRHLAGATPQPAEALDEVAASLSAWAGAWMAARHLPPSGSRLAGCAAGLRLLGYRPDAPPVELPRDARTGQYQVRAGEPLLVELSNRSSEPLWMTLLDIGLMGAVTIAYPPHQEQLAPGSFRLGEGGTIHLTLPEGFPSGFTGGHERLILLLTEQPTDFTLFTQEGARELSQRPADMAWDSASVDLWVTRA